MPLFYELNLLFLHIPKTGGTSVENYFRNNHGFCQDTYHYFNHPKIKEHPRQHCTYSELEDEIENIETYKCFIVVRNPLHRIISEINYLEKVIKIVLEGDTIDEKIFNILTKTKYGDYENHLIPQYDFFLKKDGTFNDKIHIMYNEKLNEDMIDWGFVNFDQMDFVTGKFSQDYDSLVTLETKRLVYNFYRKDYETFYKDIKY